jgi:hypothetical protein
MKSDTKILLLGSANFQDLTFTTLCITVAGRTHLNALMLI